MNSKVKTLISGVCLSASLLAAAMPQAMALEDSAHTEQTCAAQTIVAPCMDYINDADITFSISGGKAYVDGWVRGQNGIATRCKITANLQVKNGLSWSTVKTWSDDQNGRKASISGSYSVSSGKTYRVSAVVTAYKGSLSESKTMISKTMGSNTDNKIGGDSNGLLKSHKTEKVHISPRKRCIGLIWIIMLSTVLDFDVT